MITISTMYMVYKTYAKLPAMVTKHILYTHICIGKFLVAITNKLQDTSIMDGKSK